MAWFERKKKGILTEISGQNDTPQGQWVKCPECNEIANRRELRDSNKVCAKCGYHHQMGSLEYFHLLFDEGKFTLYDEHLYSVDALSFVDKKPYPSRLDAAVAKTKMNDAIRSAMGEVGGHRMAIAALDFSFIGGSMGSVVGEIVARTIHRAYTEGVPAMVISQSGGARMMEGALSLMQLAKTSAHLGVMAERRLPYISLMTNPTTGGVTASFAMLGDFNLAEPGALIGFAGPRVIRETIGQDLPPGFQTSEFLQEKGFIDIIVDRRRLRNQIIQLLDLVMETR